MSKTIKPRNKYSFDLMKVGDTTKFKIPEDKPQAGARTLCAAYAFARRNKRKFCGETVLFRGKKSMHIRRIK